MKRTAFLVVSLSAIGCAQGGVMELEDSGTDLIDPIDPMIEPDAPCLDTMTDVMNCGACGIHCRPGATCVGGVCSCAGGVCSGGGGVEICDNGMDDDDNGYPDCADAACASDAACATSTCAGLSMMTSTTGILSDGPGDYDNTSDCAWVIGPPGATAIELTFNQLDTESCCDEVTVYEGTDDSGRLLGTFKGTTLPARIMARGGSMFVTFTSDGSVTNAGFEAMYTARTTPIEICGNGADDDDNGAMDCANPECDGDASCLCDGLLALTSATGEITDGSGSGDYENSMDCSWQIQIPGAAHVRLDFSELSLESCCDEINVFEGADAMGRLLGTFTGSSVPMEVTANGSSMFVTFSTDSSVVYPGFRATYDAR